MRGALALVVAATIAAAPARVHAQAPDGATARHLLAGVRAFQDARYEEALVELKVVARAPDAPDDLAFYLGPTYYKLGRYRDALVTFVTSKAPADALTSFYLGETYYRLQLYRKARDVFAGLRTRGLGPVLDDAAARYVALVDAVYQLPPAATTIDYYADLGRAQLAAGDPVLAGEILDEARQVEARATARHRRAEILAALGVAWNDGHRAADVIAALAPEAADPAVALQLGRAHVALGDAARAHATLDPIVTGGGPQADAARAILRALP